MPSTLLRRAADRIAQFWAPHPGRHTREARTRVALGVLIALSEPSAPVPPHRDSALLSRVLWGLQALDTAPASNEVMA